VTSHLERRRKKLKAKRRKRKKVIFGTSDDVIKGKFRRTLHSY